LYRFNAQGERVYLDAEARARELEQTQKVVTDNCRT
jgi:hypothetical protein